MEEPSEPRSARSHTPRLAVPWWGQVLLGVGCAAAGVVLLFSPTAALAVLVSLLAAVLLLTALVEAASAVAGGSASPWVCLAAVACAAAGVAAAVWPAPALTVVAYLAGGALVVSGYVQTNPDVNADAYLASATRTIVAQTTTRCLGEPEVFVSVGTALLRPKNIFSTNPTTGAVGARLRENSADGHIQAPVLLGQGGADPLVLPTVQSAYEASCAAGTRIDHRVHPGRDNVGVVADDSPLIPQLPTWTSDRMSNVPAPDNCHA